jgi:glutathione S-transferase
MRSEVISAKIEELYPSPSAHLDSPYWPKVSALVDQMNRLRPIYMHAAYTNVLHEGSADFFYRDRSEKVGMPLEKLLEARGGAEKLFDSFEAVMKDATALLKENGDGPYFEGKTVGYADFVWVTFLLFFRRLDQKFLDELLKRAGDADVHLKLLEATAQWYARDTY